MSFAEIARKIISKIKTNIEESDATPEIPSKTLIYLIQRNLTNFFFKNAYIVANGCMMVWSVLYHSVLGFILLIWANLIWVRKNRRVMMMNSSPFLVIYANILLILNYLIVLKTFDISNYVDETKLLQLGFLYESDYPGLQLLFKCGFTVSFWFTSRLKFQEKMLKQRKPTLTFEETVQVMMQTEKSRKSVSWKF